MVLVEEGGATPWKTRGPIPNDPSQTGQSRAPPFLYPDRVADSQMCSCRPLPGLPCRGGAGHPITRETVAKQVLGISRPGSFRTNRRTRRLAATDLSIGSHRAKVLAADLAWPPSAHDLRRHLRSFAACIRPPSCLSRAGRTSACSGCQADCGRTVVCGRRGGRRKPPLMLKSPLALAPGPLRPACAARRTRPCRHRPAAAPPRPPDKPPSGARMRRAPPSHRVQNRELLDVDVMIMGGARIAWGRHLEMVGIVERPPAGVVKGQEGLHRGHPAL